MGSFAVRFLISSIHPQGITRPVGTLFREERMSEGLPTDHRSLTTDY